MVRELAEKISNLRPPTTSSLTIMEIARDYIALMVTTRVANSVGGNPCILNQIERSLR